MIIKIRHRQKLKTPDGEVLCGECAMPTPTKQIITISRKENKTINQYAGTLLHELLHSWINLLERKGFETSEVKEEKFIGRAEQIIIKEFKKQFLNRR